MYVEEIIRWVTQSHAFHITWCTYGLISLARFLVRLRLNQHLSSIDADISNAQTETYQNPSKLPISSWPRKALPYPYWTVVQIMSWFIPHPFRDCSLAINRSPHMAASPTGQPFCGFKVHSQHGSYGLWLHLQWQWQAETTTYEFIMHACIHGQWTHTHTHTPLLLNGIMS